MANEAREALARNSSEINNNAEIDAVVIKLTDTYVMLDGTAAEAIASQAQGDTIRLKIDSKKESSLNNAQRTALSAFSYCSPFEAYFESGGEKIRDFGGGQATVSVKQGIPEGMDARYFYICYVPEDGNLTVHKTWYENGMLSFKTGHFSDYAIVYDDSKDYVAIHRLYNPYSGEHFFTGYSIERDVLVGVGWNYEGISCYAPQSSGVPVYRLYNQYTGDHHYTADNVERDYLIELGWNYEGIGWYSSDSEGGTEVYRLYNPYDYQHLWTTNKGEYDYLGSIGWNKEGVAFKVQ